jgi:hypothetical protein
MTKEVNYLQELEEEKKIETSLTELLHHKIIGICIHRSTAGKATLFLNKLQLIIEKSSLKNKILITVETGTQTSSIQLKIKWN